MAENRGRDATLGAILGALFGLLAVIGYAIAGHKTPPAWCALIETYSPRSPES